MMGSFCFDKKSLFQIKLITTVKTVIFELFVMWKTINYEIFSVYLLSGFVKKKKTCYNVY